MDFTLNNGLSMIGGDDFTTINDEIATLNDTVVFKAGTQTITGDKTITGVLAVNNADTTIVGTTVSINSDGLALNSANGTAKYQHNATQSNIQNNNVYIADVAGTSGIIVSAGSVALEAPTAGSITQDIGVNTKSLITNTATTLTNTTTNIVSGANTKASISGTTTTLTNDTTNIVSGTNKVAITSADTTLTNDTTNIVSGVNNNVAITSTATTLDNTTTNIRSGGTNKITTNATTTTLTNTTVNIGGTTGGVKLTGTTGGISLTTTGVADIIVNASGAGGFLTMSSANTTLNDDTGANKFIQDSSTTKLYNAGITLATAFPATSANTKYIHSTTATTITNTTINLQDATPTTRFTQNNGTTTLTNTSINAVGSLYTSAYLLGTSGGSNIRLASMTLPLGIIAIPTGSSSPITQTGNWSPSGSSVQIRTPEWGSFFPLYAMIGFDNGTITGGGTMTVAIRLREETNNYDYTTDAFSLASATLNAPTGLAGNFTTFTAGSFGFISGGVLIRAQIVLTRTANITASTKSCYFTAYGYQTR